MFCSLLVLICHNYIGKFLSSIILFLCLIEEPIFNRKENFYKKSTKSFYTFTSVNLLIVRLFLLNIFREYSGTKFLEAP